MIGTMKPYLVLTITALLLVENVIFSQANIWGSIFRKKTKYTPLVFFKVPKGQLEASDEMEKIVSEIEKDLGVTVQRFDIMRDRFARNLYEKIDEIEFVGDIPLLYHRESRQSIYGTDDKTRVKAWAKGRWLTPKQSDDDIPSGEAMTEDFTPDEDEMMDNDLTEIQQEGRKRMIDRMERDGDRS